MEGWGGLHRAVSLSTNTIMNSHRCFHSVSTMRAPDRDAQLRVATLGLTAHPSLTCQICCICLSRLCHTVISQTPPISLPQGRDFTKPAKRNNSFLQISVF